MNIHKLIVSDAGQLHEEESFLKNTLANMALEVIESRIRKNKRSLPSITEGYMVLIKEFYRRKAEDDQYDKESV